jgi:hypothetical protein
MTHQLESSAGPTDKVLTHTAAAVLTQGGADKHEQREEVCGAVQSGGDANADG